MFKVHYFRQPFLRQVKHNASSLQGPKGLCYIIAIYCEIEKTTNRLLGQRSELNFHFCGTFFLYFGIRIASNRHSHWPRGLRRRSTAARLLRSWIQIQPRAWMFVCCVCYVLSGRGLRDELITRPVGSNRLWRVVVCDHETSWKMRP
jgi:hypothetical protein